MKEYINNEVLMDKNNTRIDRTMYHGRVTKACIASLVVYTYLFTFRLTEGSNDDWHFYDVKIRLKNFLIYADDHTLVHNSSSTDAYKENILTFKLDGLRSFSTITILLPKQQSYSDDGNYYLTLCEVEIYAAPRPACNARQENVTNGQLQIYNYTGRLINDQYTVGTIIEVNCKEKHRPVGIPHLECLASGKYDYPIPTCVEPLCVVPSVANGKFINVLTTKFEVGTTLHFTCDQGFTAGASNDTITCEENFHWNTLPMCELKPDISSGNSVVAICVVISVVIIALIVLVKVIPALLVFLYQRRRRRQRKTMELPYRYSWIGSESVTCVEHVEGEVSGRPANSPTRHSLTRAEDKLCADTT